MSRGKRRLLFTLGIFFVLSGLAQPYFIFLALKNPPPSKLVPDAFSFLIGIPWASMVCFLGIFGGLGLLARSKPGWILAIAFCATTLFSEFVQIVGRLLHVIDDGLPWFHTIVVASVWAGFLSFLLSTPVRSKFTGPRSDRR